MTTTWETYQEVARHLLNEITHRFGVHRFEGEQDVEGKVTTWKIEAKGVRDDSELFLIVECRRKTTHRLTQEDLGAIAYRIHDTGADGGIVVTPLPLQEGAKRIAASENIVSVRLTPESTTEEYVLEFLNEIRIGLVDHFPEPKESLEVTLIDRNGSVVKKLSF